jgi:hypothetical protein
LEEIKVDSLDVVYKFKWDHQGQKIPGRTMNEASVLHELDEEDYCALINGRCLESSACTLVLVRRRRQLIDGTQTPKKTLGATTGDKGGQEW